jgi:hypothetical protein
MNRLMSSFLSLAACARPVGNNFLGILHVCELFEI